MAKIAEFAKTFLGQPRQSQRSDVAEISARFTFEQLEKAALVAQQNGAFRTAYADLPPLKKPADVTHEVEALRASLFDPAFEPMSTAKSPVGGKDIIQASSNTFYPGLSLDDLKGFQEKYPLNSRVVKSSKARTANLPNSSTAPARPTARFLRALCNVFEEG